MRFSVLVVDDHPLLRRGITSVIESDPRLTLVGEADGGLKLSTAMRVLRPDVVVVNLWLGESADVDGIRKIRAIDAASRIVNVSRHAGGGNREEVFRAGARGYLRSDASNDELLDCILEVAAGGTYLGSTTTPGIACSPWFDALSRRELDILKLVSTGKSNRDVGKTAGISEETVKSHVNSILSKLGVSSRTEAVSVAVRRGVISFS